MLWSAWLFIGLVALVVGGVAILTDDNGVAIVSGTLGFVLWALWAFAALNIEVPNNGGVEVFSMPSVTVIGIALALIPAYIALTGPVELVSRVYNPEPRDV